MRGVTTRRIERLYRDRYLRFHRVAASVVRDGVRAHDVVHEAFCRALEAAGSFRGDGPLEAWLMRIVLRVAYDERLDTRAAVPEMIAVALPFPERDVELAFAVSALPPRRRLIVFLRYWADMTVADIAATLQVSEGTVSATLTQARNELRGALTHDVEEAAR